jgi:hypothetical protein
MLMSLRHVTGDALAVATLDDVSTDELAAAPLRFVDNRHDRFDRAPDGTRLL